VLHAVATAVHVALRGAPFEGVGGSLAQHNCARALFFTTSCTPVHTPPWWPAWLRAPGAAGAGVAPWGWPKVGAKQGVPCAGHVLDPWRGNRSKHEQTRPARRLDVPTLRPRPALTAHAACGRRRTAHTAQGQHNRCVRGPGHWFCGSAARACAGGSLLPLPLQRCGVSGATAHCQLAVGGRHAW